VVLLYLIPIITKEICPEIKSGKGAESTEKQSEN
jgi:hypothetical protein